MAKKSLKKATKTRAPEAGVNQTDRAYPAEPQEIDAQQQRLKRAAAVAAEALKSSAPAPQPARLPIQCEPTQPPGEAAEAAEAPPLPAPRSVKVGFVLLDLGAKQVSLCGDFNGWASDSTPMKRDNAGHWRTTIELAPGRYQYKFIVDGQWIPDPLAQEQVWNYHGTLNSVIEVRA